MERDGCRAAGVVKSTGLASFRCWDEGKRRAKASEPQAAGWVPGAVLRGAGRRSRLGGKRRCLSGCAEVFTAHRRETLGDGGEERSWMRSFWEREAGWAAGAEAVGRVCKFSWPQGR